MKIAGLQRVTLIDYPGLIAASVFIAGCNLECGYCYNRWMIRESEVRAALSLDELYTWLQTRVGKLQGVCVTGGEPLIHSEVLELLRQIRQIGFKIKLDTNGTIPARLQQVLSEHLVAYVAMDLKGPLDARYQHFVGVPLDISTIFNSMQLLRAGGIPYEYRTTVCPGFTFAELSAIALALQPQETWYLQPFVPAETVNGEWRNRPALSLADLLAAAKKLRPQLPLVSVRGLESDDTDGSNAQ